MATVKAEDSITARPVPAASQEPSTRASTPPAADEEKKVRHVVVDSRGLKHNGRNYAKDDGISLAPSDPLTEHLVAQRMVVRAAE